MQAVQQYPRTPEALEALEEALCKHHGDLNAAARSLNYPARYVHMWMLSDPEVATRIKQAQMIGWAGLETVLYERAVIGVEEPVYYQGEEVGTKTVRSDSLLALMAKARIPGYSDAQQHQHLHMVNVNLMPRATSYEDWQEQRSLELQKDGDDPPTNPLKVQALPDWPRASEQVIQGRVRELTRVSPGLRDVL